MRKTPLKRKTPLRVDPEKIKDWKNRSRTRIPPVAKKRASQTRDYSSDRRDFLREHPTCAITGDPSTDIHHSAHKEGEWLNIKRYWIALSRRAHRWVTDNAATAARANLIVYINPSITAKQHLEWMKINGVNPDVPVFYKELDLYKNELESIREQVNRSK